MAYNFEKLEALLKEKGVNKGEIEEIITPLKNMARQRRYGLVWEEPGETSYDKDKAEKALEKAFAFLKEVPEKRIEKAPEKPMNLLIEGDNYHSLKALQYTHKGLVDVIYIDPPYNTGHKDFVYNDRYVDSEDSWRHSSWLSFMNKRLKLARELMSEDGVIFISIDDNEMAQLKLMCDRIFGEKNFIANAIIQGTPKNDPLFIATSHEYCLAYVKDVSVAKTKEWGVKNELIPQLYALIEDLENSEEAEKALKLFYKNNGLTKDNISNYKYIDDMGIYRTGPIDDPQGKGGKDIRINPMTGELLKTPNRGWRCSIHTWNDWISKGLIKFPEDNTKLVSKKTYLIESKLNVVNSVMQFQTRKSTVLLKDMFGKKVFNHPKSMDFLKVLLKGTNNKNALILDFFAGSGTTGHAVMELNKEDGGNRQFILCTNNENNIAEEVTYARLNHVIEGYSTTKGKAIEGIPNNLSYYKVDLMEDTGDSDQNRLQAIQNAVDLIAIKEQTYQREDKNRLSVLRKKEKVVYVVTDFFSLLDEDMDEIVSSLMQEPETEKVLYTNYAEYAQEQILYRGEDMPEELLSILK